MPACVCAYECTSVPVNVVFARWCFMGRCWCKSVTRKCKTWRAIEQVRVFYCCTCVLICAALVCALQCWCKCVTRKCKTWRTVTLVCMCMRISTCQHCVCSCCFLLGDVGVRVSHESARHEGQSRNVCVCMNAHQYPSVLCLRICALWGDVGVKVSHASARHGGQSSKRVVE